MNVRAVCWTLVLSCGAAAQAAPETKAKRAPIYETVRSDRSLEFTFNPHHGKGAAIVAFSFSYRGRRDRRATIAGRVHNGWNDAYGRCLKLLASHSCPSLLRRPGIEPALRDCLSVALFPDGNAIVTEIHLTRMVVQAEGPRRDKELNARLAETRDRMVQLMRKATDPGTAVAYGFRCLSDRDRSVRLLAATTIGRHGALARHVAPPLASLFVGKEPDFVRETILAVGMLGDAATEAIPALTKLARSSDRQTAAMARAALRQIRGNRSDRGAARLR